MRRLLILFLLIVPSLAWAALPAEELWREGLISEHVGFGNPTGGQGGTLCTVNTLANSGGSGTAGSLRYCATLSGAYWIIFSVSGTITLTGSTVDVTSNKTIDGRGADITISGSNFWINNVDNIIFTHLKFDNFTNDGIDIRSFDGNPHGNFWINHVTVGQNFGDEWLDIDCATSGGAGLTGITISWSRLSPIPAHEGPMLFTSSGGSAQACNNGTRITLHHNYYVEVGRRLPMMRRAQVHAFNNYYKNTQACASPPCMAVHVRTLGQFYSENDIFECVAPYCDNAGPYSVGGKWPRITRRDFPGDATDSAPSNLRIIGQWSVTGDETYDTELNPGTIFTPSASYSYTPATANAALRDAIIAQAGWQNVTAPASTLIAWWDFDETSGSTTAVDSVGGFTGTLTNMAPSTDWVTGKLGTALNFDGVDGFVATTFTTSLGVNPYSVSIWFKATGTAARTDAIWAKRPSSSNQLTLFICGDDQCDTDGNQLVIYEGTSPTPSRSAISGVSVLDNAWHLATITRDATSLLLYLDGVLVDTATGTIPTITSTTPLVIGNSNNTVADDEFLGLLDDMRLYTGVLTAPEVLNLYNAATCTLTPVVATFQDGTTFMFGRNLVTGITPDSVPPHTGSTLRLFQNSVELGPAHSTDGDIQTIGLGRFRHACCASEALLWSASDNTNVISNGRTYAWTNGCTPDVVAESTPPGTPANLRVVSP